MTRGLASRDWVGVAAAVIGILGLASFLPGPIFAQSLRVSEAETLVRSTYFEGFPEKEALRIGPAAAARLVEMLGDPAESNAQANILVALGVCGQPGALDAILAWAAIPRQGEIDRDTFSAWQALPYALGHAAEQDRRAIVRLEARLAGETPSWTFHHQRGPRLHRLARRGAATALAMTGLPEAGRALDRAERRETDPEFEGHLRELRGMFEQRAAGRRSR